MTLDEAIVHCEEVADRCDVTDGNIKCAKDHRQLAGWLKELKQLREQKVRDYEQRRADTGISKQAVNK